MSYLYLGSFSCLNSYKVGIFKSYTFESATFKSVTFLHFQRFNFSKCLKCVENDPSTLVFYYLEDTNMTLFKLLKFYACKSLAPFKYEKYTYNKIDFCKL